MTKASTSTLRSGCAACDRGRSACQGARSYGSVVQTPLAALLRMHPAGGQTHTPLRHGAGGVSVRIRGVDPFHRGVAQMYGAGGTMAFGYDPVWRRSGGPLAHLESGCHQCRKIPGTQPSLWERCCTCVWLGSQGDLAADYRRKPPLWWLTCQALGASRDWRHTRTHWLRGPEDCIAALRSREVPKIGKPGARGPRHACLPRPRGGRRAYIFRRRLQRRRG